MGLLDMLFSENNGGLLGGLPREWQYQNPSSQGFGAAPTQGPIFAGQPLGQIMGGMAPLAAPPAQQPSGAPMNPTEQQMMSLLGRPGYQPGLPDAGPTAAPASAPTMAAPAPDPAQAGPIGVGGYQMPRVGAPDLYQPEQVNTPPQAQPAQGMQARPVPPSFIQPPTAAGFGGAARGALANMHTGPLGMIAGILAGGMGMGQGSPQDIARQNQQAQYQAFIGAGMTPQNAMLAVLNPEAAKTLVGETLTNKEKYQKTGVDAFGNENYGFVNERDQTINGRPIGQGEAGGSASGGFLAPGVKQIDSSLTGNDYLKQFSPEIQAAVENYVQGKSTPTGNPRKGFTQTVKMIAQKYGADTGQSVDDATFAARKQMRNQLSSSAPSSLGGQINIGNTAAGHLADLTERAIDLGNWDTGLSPLTHLVNSARGLGTEQAAKMEALKGAAQHYGQEITKFYAGSPGGTAERDRFIESVNGARSPKELAAILATEGELMRSRLDALGGQIQGVLGDEGAKQYPVLRADGQAALAKVEHNVSVLKGATPAGAAASPGALPSGWSVQVR
jgi:hypothetical protein